MALTACLLALTASCGSRPKTFDISRPAPRLMAYTVARPVQMPAVAAASWALAVHADSQKRWIMAIAEAATRSPPPEPRPVAVSAPPSDLGGVMRCIKDHESGDYAESSHPSAGSGAYQYVPGTWRSWSERAGYPGYEYAYQAPPEIQDAVTVHALTQGGAGNWSPRYGDDPCTVGMGG